MTSKDWILLIVPIISNSLIFYLLHIYFENKMKVKNEYKSHQRTLKREVYKYCNVSISHLNELVDNYYKKEFKERAEIIIKVLENIETIRATVMDNVELGDFTQRLNSIITLANYIEKEICKYKSTNMLEEEKNSSIELLRGELYILMLELNQMKKMCMDLQ